ncbi:DNA double-strand break repair nuclease NurA [Aeromonas dhakensis]|uniref:DNA double-strand break repair nuclease NurA n=1 Tax=Aeromonas dhakensis TaxID=196024 RepID=UPI0038F6AADA
MPYSNEFAQHKVLGRFTDSPEIKKLLEGFKEPEYPEDEMTCGLKIERNQWKPKYVVAIDGSHKELQYDKGFPGAELGFISIATVLIKVDKLIEASRKTTIDPVEFNQVQSSYPLSAVLPSSNMIHLNFPDARSSFRFSWFELLKNTRPAERSESLLETYEALLSLKPTESDQKCPMMDLCESDGVSNPDYKKGKCACGKYDVYLTDSLRIHERFSDSKSNGESFGEVMRVLEHLLLVGFIRHMERLCNDSGNWSMFEDTAIVMDGSLAVFGHPAWLSQAIKSELKRLNKRVKEKTGKEMLVFGIEKSGRFFEHWCRLDTKSKRDFEQERKLAADEYVDPNEFKVYQPGRIPKQSVMLINDKYIKKYIVPSESTKPHGKDTYYGRPFLYKTSTGAMIVGISAILSQEQEDRMNALPENYPRLSDTLDLLDLLVSMRYPNAVIPLIAAHSEAAIPLQMGEKVLDMLAREHVGSNSA